MSKVVLILISFVSLTCQAQTEQQVIQEITRIEIEWHNVYKSKDTLPLFRILSPDFVHINRLGNKFTFQEEVNSVKTDQAVYDSIYPYDMKFRVSPASVMVTGKTREVGYYPDGKPFSNDYFWTDVFEKNKAGWQAVLAQTAPINKSDLFFAPRLQNRDTAVAFATHRWVTALAKEDKFSGVVLIAREDKIIYESAWGSSSKDFNVSNSFRTKFNLASMTKMFTGVAIAQLVQEGKLGFDDPVEKYLSGLPVGLTKGITIRHLLLHTSGLNHYWTAEFHNSNHAAYRTLEDYIPLIKDDKPSFAPGSKWQYSNTGYLLLGLVIEKLTGQTYFDYVRENIFKKANMQNSDFYESDLPVRNIAYGYTRYNRYLPDKKGYSNTFFLAPVKGSPAGGAYATAEDLHNFYKALYGHKLLNKALTDTVQKGQAAYDKPEFRKAYGFGFANQYVNDKLIVFHDGGANGISTIMDMYPSSGYTVIVLCNYDEGAWSIAKQVRQLITQQ